MALLLPIDPDAAESAATDALRKAAAALGGATPNLTRVMAHSPTTLHGYLDVASALDHGVLEPGVRERIALLVAEQNRCTYCLSAHAYVAQRALGPPGAEISAARQGPRADPRIRTVLGLASAINIGRGDVDEGVVEAARTAGVTDTEIVEVIADVAANTFTNYFAKTTRVDIDLPRVAPGEGAA